MIALDYVKAPISTSSPTAGMSYGLRLRRFATLAWELQERERLHLRAEIARIPGLMSLLMKPRNGEPWTQEERALLQVQLRGLGLIVLYLATLMVPGTTLTLPLLAWWLDRRRFRGVAALSADNLSKVPTPPTR